MTKKHNELVEEIVHDIEMYHRWASQGTTYHDTSQRIARGIITLILSAVRDGLEIPGEVGRWIWPIGKPASEKVSHWATRITHREGANELIALRKEEEKDVKQK